VDRPRARGARVSPSWREARAALAASGEASCRGARPGSPDHGYYLQVRERRDHQRACLSVARKLCRRSYHILRELGDEALAPVDELLPAAQELIRPAA
jgi:hypothetical protein